MVVNLLWVGGGQQAHPQPLGDKNGEGFTFYLIEALANGRGEGLKR
jgi:hypothetical protein